MNTGELGCHVIRLYKSLYRVLFYSLSFVSSRLRSYELRCPFWKELWFYGFFLDSTMSGYASVSMYYERFPSFIG